MKPENQFLTNAIWNNPYANHAGRCVSNDFIGYDFFNEVGHPLDIDGHGTRVNSLLTNAFSSEIGLHLMNLKFYEAQQGKLFDAICSIYYAIENGANIINLSWGFETSEYPSLLKQVLEYAAQKDILVVTTAGNTSKNNDFINKYPANFDLDNLIVVAAYQQKEGEAIKLSNYSSYGRSTVDIAAPGFVATPDLAGQISLSAGTSLAAPYVTKTAALIKGYYPILSATEIKDCILSTAATAANLQHLVVTNGVLDESAALACAQQKAMTIIENGCNSSNLILTPHITPESCHKNDGVITLNHNAPPDSIHFLWSNGSNTSIISNLSSGQYEVTATNVNRCEVVLSITVTSNCEGGSCQPSTVTNGSIAADSTYHSTDWLESNATITVGSEVIFKAANNITLKDGFAVERGATFSAAIAPCIPSSPLNQPNQQINYVANLPNNVKIYPNPTNGIIQIHRAAQRTEQFTLFNVIGKKIRQWTIKELNFELDLSTEPTGTYFLVSDQLTHFKLILHKE